MSCVGRKSRGGQRVAPSRGSGRRDEENTGAKGTRGPKTPAALNCTHLGLLELPGVPGLEEAVQLPVKELEAHGQGGGAPGREDPLEVQEVHCMGLDPLGGREAAQEPLPLPFHLELAGAARLRRQGGLRPGGGGGRPHGSGRRRTQGLGWRILGSGGEGRTEAQGDGLGQVGRRRRREEGGKYSRAPLSRRPAETSAPCGPRRLPRKPPDARPPARRGSPGGRRCLRSAAS